MAPALALAAGALATIPSPSLAATRADRRATGAYLRASLKFDRAVVANGASAETSVAAFAKRLGSECPGVLAGAPDPELLGRHVTPEQVKQVEQRGALQSEVLSGLVGAWIAPDRASFETFARAVGPLRWHEPRIARLVHAEIAEFEAFLAPGPDICADMRAWVASGYETLPPGASTNALSTTGEGSGPSLEQSLKQFEDPVQKASAKRQRKRVKHRLKRQLEGALNSAPALLSTLGAKLPGLAGLPPQEAEPVDPIGHGRTAANTTYAISSTGPAYDCPISLKVTELSHGNRATSSECFSPSSAHSLGVTTSCNEGDLTILAPLPAQVQSVALKLANGRRIVSRTSSVPAKDGGPLALYYQALPRSSARPVSLIELDAQGRATGAVRIPRTGACEPRRPGGSTGSGRTGVANGR